MQVEQFHYRVAWRARGARPGFHAGTQSGGGYEFRGYASLLEAPDPRRFDLRASLRDPFGRLIVRRYTQRSAIPVIAVADLSASMGFRGATCRLDLLADFVRSLGYSAYRTGDPFGFIGCAQTPLPAWWLPPTRAKAAGPALAQRLRAHVPAGTGCIGLRDAASLIPRVRCVVFLLSDFHFPLALLDQILDRLAGHAVVPVVLWDSAEVEPAGRGFARVRDAETGRQRAVLMRRALRARIAAGFAERRQHLERCFALRGVRGLFMRDHFEAEDVTRYFYQ